MPHIAENPERWIARVVHNGHCARLVQEACGGLGHTSTWRRGAKARGSGAEPGTIIATFDPNGRYGNHTDGRSHAAILIAEEENGLRCVDQWVGHPVAPRTIRFRGGQGRWVNDGDRFYVVEHETA
jgi:hypothetical protein